MLVMLEITYVTMLAISEMVSFACIASIRLVKVSAVLERSLPSLDNCELPIASPRDSTSLPRSEIAPIPSLILSNIFFSFSTSVSSMITPNSLSEAISISIRAFSSSVTPFR